MKCHGFIIQRKGINNMKDAIYSAKFISGPEEWGKQCTVFHRAAAGHGHGCDDVDQNRHSDSAQLSGNPKYEGCPGKAAERR